MHTVYMAIPFQFFTVILHKYLVRLHVNQALESSGRVSVAQGVNCVLKPETIFLRAS